MMSKKVKIFALVVVGLAAVIGAFSLFGGSGVEEDPVTTIPRATGTPSPSSGISTSATPGGMPGGMPGGPVAAIPGGPMTMPTPGQTSMAANEFSGLLSSVNSISIDTSIFQNAAYKTLRDYPVMLGTDIIGRINPFAPVGNDAAGTGEGTSTVVLVQTLAPGKITTTSAEVGADITVPDTVSTTVVFQYGISDTFGNTTSPVTLTKSGTTLATIIGLAPGTKYFVQAVVVRGSSTTIGNVMTFTTAGTSGAPVAQ
ncbi:MAG TPA: hypothetical protein VGE18_02630 [Candidatus Paceibacterota bacterium]